MASEAKTAPQVVPNMRVGRYDWKAKREAKTPGYKNLLVHTKGIFSPYVLKNKAGQLHENIYQFKKVYPKVYNQRQMMPYSSDKMWFWDEAYHVIEKKGYVRPDFLLPHQKDWSFRYEILPAYWKWRTAGLSNKVAVRRPNGFHAGECLFSLTLITTKEEEADLLKNDPGRVFTSPDGHKFKALTYVEARVEIYFKTYHQLISAEPEFISLKMEIVEGKKYQVNEVDGPKLLEDFPYSKTVNDSLPVTKELVEASLNYLKHPWGHGWVLSILIQGKEEWVYGCKLLS